jgi:hypothetical protein
LHLGKVIAVDFDGDITTHPGNQLVKAHLNGLGKFVVVAWKGLECGFQAFE